MKQKSIGDSHSYSCNEDAKLETHAHTYITINVTSPMINPLSGKHYYA
jgi:hypothetical protein